jgi:hypothetical protein
MADVIQPDGHALGGELPQPVAPAGPAAGTDLVRPLAAGPAVCWRRGPP